MYFYPGMCAPLPITKGSHSYSFIVMIVLNFVIFVFIGLGQVLIYLSLKSHSMISRDNASTNQNDTRMSKMSDDTVPTNQQNKSKMAVENVTSFARANENKDKAVARRLFSVVTSDFLCWFPIGAVGLAAASGVPVPGYFNVAFGILVLPVNSALNPFLYTLNVLMEKRKRARELRLHKMLLAQIKAGKL